MLSDEGKDPWDFINDEQFVKRLNEKFYYLEWPTIIATSYVRNSVDHVYYMKKQTFSKFHYICS